MSLEGPLPGNSPARTNLYLEGPGVRQLEEQNLTNNQKETAQIAFSGYLLNQLVPIAIADLPLLREININTSPDHTQDRFDKQLMIDHIAGLNQAYAIVAMKAKGEEYDEALEGFTKSRQNGPELITKIEGTYGKIEEKRRQIFEEAKNSHWLKQETKILLTEIGTKLRLGGDQIGLLYTNTDTSYEAQEAKTYRGWLKTIRNVAVLESLPHLAGGGTTLLDNIGNTNDLRKTAIALNVAMWAIMYGLNATRNTEYLTESGGGISLGSKLGQQVGKFFTKNPEALKKWTTAGHVGDLTAWEFAYIFESLGVAGLFGTDAGWKYWGGAAAFGLVKNAGITVAFEGRKIKNRAKEVGYKGAIIEYKDDFVKKCGHAAEKCKCFLKGGPSLADITISIPVKRPVHLTEGQVTQIVPIANSKDL